MVVGKQNPNHTMLVTPSASRYDARPCPRLIKMRNSAPISQARERIFSRPKPGAFWPSHPRPCLALPGRTVCNSYAVEHHAPRRPCLTGVRQRLLRDPQQVRFPLFRIARTVARRQDRVKPRFQKPEVNLFAPIVQLGDQTPTLQRSGTQRRLTERRASSRLCRASSRAFSKCWRAPGESASIRCSAAFNCIMMP